MNIIIAILRLVVLLSCLGGKYAVGHPRIRILIFLSQRCTGYGIDFAQSVSRALRHSATGPEEHDLSVPTHLMNFLMRGAETPVEPVGFDM